jgi:hypothetical protein
MPHDQQPVRIRVGKSWVVEVGWSFGNVEWVGQATVVLM